MLMFLLDVGEQRTMFNSLRDYYLKISKWIKFLSIAY